jgi:hypothetical protein
LRKKAAADRAAKAIAEIKERKEEIERMQKEKLLEVKQQLVNKERNRENKMHTVAEDRAAKA